MNPLQRPDDLVPETPGSLSLRALWHDGTPAERWRVLGGWTLTVAACLLLGLATVRRGWSGIPLDLGGATAFLTFYPPIPLCLWWTLCFGWRWGALPAWLATFVLALDAGMPPAWAAIFACANPLGFAVMALGYRAVGAARGLRSLRAWLFFLPLCFVAAVFSSAGALLWTFSRHLSAQEQLPIWQGWWLGAFLQSAVFGGALMTLTWPRLSRWIVARSTLFSPPPRGRRAMGLGLLFAIVLAVQAYGLVSLGLGSLQLREALHSGEWARLEEAARVMVSTAWVFFWVFVLIVLFVAQFGYQALARWLRSTEALVTQLAKVNAELEQRSRTDGLTGLANRMATEEGLRALLRTVRRYRTPAALLMLDIDHFKQVNDRHGHAAGDVVIRALARALKDTSRDVDLPGRFGGEEFVVGLAHTDLEGARHFAERLRERIAAAPVEIPGGAPVTYTVSIGVTVMREDDAGIEDSLRRADAAMYRAKQGGRDRVELDAAAPGTATMPGAAGKS
ncbi:MAG: sensor domain-containing diguanylate cyclase [Mitsuaria chitosanitabida]|uniref:GGDEF domain-containing protein n=1 Tax=Roseateles chitosanitabidus TaxID=65048 RepID=UPI001B265888|nr:GGDEF domain-containing protein [Roseateles chitosanitabidus]MBO9686924.1 sensor domain-containing diguanylate cyclase [Roseateles chitosanitabidus]